KDLSIRRKNEKEQLEMNLAELDAELARLPECETELAAAQEGLLQITEQIKTGESRLAALRQSRENLEAKRIAFTQLDNSFAQKSRTLTQINAQLQQVQTRIAEHENVLLQRQEIEAGYAEFVAAREKNDLLNQNLAIFNKLNEKRHALEMSVARQSQELNKEHARIGERVNEMEKIISGLPLLREEKTKLQQHSQQILQKEELLRQRKQSAQELLVELRANESDRKRLQHEIEEITEKIKLLRVEKSAKCPLCGCELGEGGVKHIELEFDAQRTVKSDLMKALQSTAQAKQIELIRISEDVKSAEQSIAREQAAAQSRLGALEKDIERGEAASRDVITENERLRQIEEQLAGQGFATVESNQLKHVLVNIAGIGYDPQLHEQARRQQDAAKKFEIPKQKLDQAVRLIEMERSTLTQTGAMIDELKTALKADEKVRLELSKELENLPLLQAELSQADNEQRILVANQQQANIRLGEIKARLQSMALFKTKKEEKSDQLRRTAEEEQVYRDLAEAFGKKGVQSLIIETALPEIENEANILLARMTDNRMNVKFESQRETQKGDVLETLDIKVADELGTRPYELFSGGEAFRINFGVRIALSRLLARRAGAPLPTLIIDEGFGTQDTVGIEKLREAITAIQDDFEKVLVITHIDELRDAFPARIDVTKEPDGSKISLN
ncbi:MAG TPA: SMC family ATPase, partial [Dehalococcoidales bacterium]|nr:SMC family ATPase [Dehalococcoidales bacterium]